MVKSVSPTGAARNNAKGTLRREIREYILSQVASGAYRAGDRIVETQLARELNVSQAPVREAILELATMGLLEERPYSGTFVRKLTSENIEDIYNTRAFIDEYAASLAAKRISDEQLAAMKELLHKMETVSDYPSYVEMDMEFHAMVVDAAGSPSLRRAWNNLRLVEWTGLSAAVTKIERPELVRQHWQIYRYLEQHADHSAGAYMFLHIKNFGDELSRYFSQQEKGDASQVHEERSIV